MLSITDALDDPALFGAWFSGPSWSAWRAVLKGAFALPMAEAEIELFRGLANRAPPKKRVREVWIIAGRRAGKDSVASAIATWFAAFVDYEGLLRPGKSASVMCLAVDRLQARIVLKYTKAYFERIPMLSGLITRETIDGLELSNNVELSVIANNFRGVRGRSIACAILDECAYYRDDNSASPDTETYSALVPGLATIPGAMIIGISSPYRRGGLLYEKWRDHFGKNDDDVLVIVAPSRTLNPSLDQRIIDAAMARDPQVARAEWLAQWRDDVSTFIPREVIDNAVDADVIVRPPVPGTRYFSFCDPSGGVGDSFTAAVAHAEGETVILDCLVEIPAPFNPTEATGSIAATLKSYGLRETVGDRYAAAWTVDAFSKCGIAYKHSQRDRSAIYADSLPIFMSGRARLIDNTKLVAQLSNLERRTSSTGRDRIDHPGGAHDDLANAAAGALGLASGSSEPGWIAFAKEMTARAYFEGVN